MPAQLHLHSIISAVGSHNEVVRSKYYDAHCAPETFASLIIYINWMLLDLGALATMRPQ